MLASWPEMTSLMKIQVSPKEQMLSPTEPFVFDIAQHF
jgi:hypothetical protein